jgi:glutathione synthase/RimK-type ligase-like ATP-grasp enzyme
MDVVLATGREMPTPDPESHLLVAALQERGLQATMVAWDEDLDWSAVPLVVVRTPWDYVDRRDEFVAWAHGVERVTRFVNPAAVIEWNSHKSYLLDLRKAGVPVVPTMLVTGGVSASSRDIALRAHDGEVVIKPAVSVGAIGALRAAADSAQAAAHLAASVEDGDVLVQPLEAAVLTEGEMSLIYFGGEFSHAIRKIPADGDYRVHEYYGGRVVPHTPSAREFGVAVKALAAVPGTTAYARVDLVRSDDPVVMELELIEPELFFRMDPESVQRFADNIAGASHST